eukprot:gene30327-39556_t
MHEFDRQRPHWMDPVVQEKYGMKVFLYQKLNASEPNYISTNQGSEAGVYLRYIVDHYHTFPDVAVFVHGFRDILKIVWEFEERDEEFQRLVPSNRPLSVWKKLLEIIGVQRVCHIGEPDYDNNFNAKLTKWKVGPEPEEIVFLAHVVYGKRGLTERTTMKDICNNFYEDCPGTLCRPTL